MTALAGTGTLIRLAARRDRVLLPVWIGAIAAVAHLVVASYQATVGDADARRLTASFGANNPMARVFDGPASGTELGAMVMVEAYLVLAVLTALMTAQAVVRHTRQEEETGRAELVGSAVVGRHSRLVTALVIALGANLTLGLALAGVLMANGLAPSGSIAAGLAVIGTGWAFAGIAAVAAQVFATARAANAATSAAIGVAFLLRAVGDLLGDVAPNGVQVVSAWPSWLSPLGWGQQVRPFFQDNWWIAALFAGLLLFLAALALLLEARRDVGIGMVASRPGPERGSRNLGSALGLAWRLQRGVFITWLLGLTVLAAAFGSIGDSAEHLVGDNDQLRQLLSRLAPGASVVDLYFAFLSAILGIAATGYTVQALLRMRAEEMTGRLEPVLATATGRHRWLTGHLLIAGLGTAAILTACGLAGGITFSLVAGEAALAGPVQAALVQIPAAWAVGGLTLAAFGVLPRWAGSIAWAALTAALVMGQLGTLLDLPQWVLDVSPFTHVPRVPAETLTAAPLLWLTAAAVALGAGAFAAFRHRDLAIGA